MKPFSTPKNAIYAAKDRGFFSCATIIIKHGVLSYQVIPWSQTCIYYFTPVRLLVLKKTTYGFLYHPRYFLVKYILNIQGV